MTKNIYFIHVKVFCYITYIVYDLHIGYNMQKYCAVYHLNLKFVLGIYER